MTTLPKGLVTSTPSISGNIERLDTVENADVARIWRVYATNRNILPNDAGRRLENLFWRTWASESLQQSISGATLARLFLRISEDHAIIRTTPVQSPRSSLQQSECQALAAGGQHPVLSANNSVPLPKAEPGKGRSQVAFGPSENPRDSTLSSGATKQAKKIPLPPILKKSRQVLQEVGESSLVETEAAPAAQRPPNDGASTSTSFPKLSTEAVRPPTPPSPKSRGASGSSGKRRKATFVTASTSNRRRPTPSRRKSSQSSTSNASTKSSTSPKPVEDTQRQSPTAVNPSDASPLTEQAHARSLQHIPPSLPDNHLEAQVSQSWVVDDNFRTRFADKRRHERVSALMTPSAQPKTAATLASMSTAIEGTVDAGASDAVLPVTASGNGKGKGKASATTTVSSAFDSIVATSTSGPAKRTIEEADKREAEEEEEEDSTPTPLLRTKSQLTLLLERNRQRTEHRDETHQHGKRTP
ncbi:MAG: hypothetical protein M1833_001628 [Piccolia ochrophora]|nr:MAG: hypothetical protein M1833_001628 [Piccolia ochrophora]